MHAPTTKPARLSSEETPSCGYKHVANAMLPLIVPSDYAQLGLAYKLENNNINFNIALTYYYSGRPEDGINQLQVAREGASLEQNSVIDDCLRDEAKVRPA